MVYDKIASTPYYRIIFTKINVYIVNEINPDMQTQFGHCTNRVYRLIVLLSGLQYAHLPNVTTLYFPNYFVPTLSEVPVADRFIIADT